MSLFHAGDRHHVGPLGWHLHEIRSIMGIISRTRINMNTDAEGEHDQPGPRPERSDTGDAGAGLVHQQTVVLLIDLVESVRLMREREAVTVRRWSDFIRIATSGILPRYQGILVKSLGDGLMARFETVRDAV